MRLSQLSEDLNTSFQYGTTVPNIHAIKRHWLQTIHKALARCLALDDRVADAAIAKLKTWMEQGGIAI